MQIEKPRRFTAYINSDHQTLYVWAQNFTQDITQTSEGQVMQVWDSAPSLPVWTSKRQQVTFWGQLSGIPGWIEMPESSHLTFSLLSASSLHSRANRVTVVQKQSDSQAPRPPMHTLSEGTGTRLCCVNNQGKGEGGGGGVKYLLSFMRPPTKCCKDPATKIICHDSSVRQNINNLSALLKRTSGELRAAQMFSQVVF